MGELLGWLEKALQPNLSPKEDEGQSLSSREGLGEGSSSKPLLSRSPGQEKRVKEEQWRQLQTLAHEIAAVLGEQSGDDELRDVYRRFNQEFGLTTYKKLPRRRFDEGLAFLTAWRDEVVATVSQDSLTNPFLQGEEVRDTLPQDSLLQENEVSIAALQDPLSSPLPQENEVSPVTPQDALLSPLPQDELAGTPDSPIHFPGYRVLSPVRIVHDKTEIEFVRVPAGPFLYGDDKKPLELPEFWIGRYPVTNIQYKRFLDANPAYSVPFYDADWAKPYNWDKKTRAYPADKADHPVVIVSWNDAKAFCDWAGLRLPTEQEWEKAARGDKDGRIYPWGDDWVDGRCNTSEAGVDGTTRVGQYSPQSDSPYGCADMAGNVWEWTASWYSEKQSGRVLRGGSWLVNQRDARVSIRDYLTPDFAFFNIGFRAAAPVDSGY